ncbi:hypothetical protein BDW02DRAFT_77504 [Decorospora gaudefroyi]|uniref:Uncharacterized protein n=1 Tax=Decorospora gaudefroyi TaxID=184978 RepID=A0A6A5K7M9_9PLEO|nr:hypothetical protein BDW02DRAFT_77504 [Decorospora gaudefroyi]
MATPLRRAAVAPLASGRGHASRRARLAVLWSRGKKGLHVPAEVGKLLVDALKSHGYCVGVWAVSGSESHVLGCGCGR